MLIAEIRRKLASLDELDADDPESLDQLRGLLRETKEDLLTADVFGVLKYLPRRPYLETVLATLVERNPASCEFRDAWPQLQANLQSLEFRFWPNYPTPNGLSDGSTEPDVQLSDERSFILFEAKLKSAFGDRQLERELAVAATEAQGREFFLVLVTPGSRPPRFRVGARRLHATDYLAALADSDELPAAARQLLAEHRRRVLWISWETIHVSLQQAHRRRCQQTDSAGESVARAADLLGDLDALMRMRQMQPFAGLARAVSNSPIRRAPDRPVFLTTTGTSRETWVPLGKCCRNWRLEPDAASTNSSLRSGLAINRSGQ
jgi:acyl carrier protein phosphodiesterase